MPVTYVGTQSWKATNLQPMIPMFHAIAMNSNFNLQVMSQLLFTELTKATNICSVFDVYIKITAMYVFQTFSGTTAVKMQRMSALNFVMKYLSVSSLTPQHLMITAGNISVSF